MKMIYSVTFYQKFHVIFIVINFNYKKVFLFTNFHYHLKPHFPLVMDWNKIYKENEMIELEKHGHQGTKEIFQPQLH